MNPDKTFSTKLGNTRAGERTRIWLEGARLTAHGFEPGTSFRKVWAEQALVLIAETYAGPKTREYGTVSGKGAKPIIDITGSQVAEWFGDHETHVTVTYRAGRITIKRAS